MAPNDVFLLAMAVIFALPYLVWRIGRTDYHAPLVVVQIVAGIALGPGIAGALAPGAYAFVFSAPVLAALGGIAAWAVMLFVWVAGVELDLSEAWTRRRETALAAGFALATPLALGAAVAGVTLTLGDHGIGGGWIGPEARPWQFVAGIGMACAVTALPILVLLMARMDILRAPLGRRILRYASLDDIAIWGVLALILLDWTRIGRQATFLAGFALASWGYRRLMRRLSQSDRWAVALIWLLVSGLCADWAGLHYMVGAFLAGAVTDARLFDDARRDLFRDTVLMALMPVFFLMTGLRTSWSSGGPAILGLAIALLAAAVGGKLAGTHIAGRLLGWRQGEAAVIGWLLQTKALIMIIFCNVLLDRGIIAAPAFTALLVMAVASTMLTVPMVTPRLARFGRHAEPGSP